MVLFHYVKANKKDGLMKVLVLLPRHCLRPYMVHLKWHTLCSFHVPSKPRSCSMSLYSFSSSLKTVIINSFGTVLDTKWATITSIRRIVENLTTREEVSHNLYISMGIIFSHNTCPYHLIHLLQLTLKNHLVPMDLQWEGKLTDF